MVPVAAGASRNAAGVPIEAAEISAERGGWPAFRYVLSLSASGMRSGLDVVSNAVCCRASP